jgi:hypothetical protein
MMCAQLSQYASMLSALYNLIIVCIQLKELTPTPPLQPTTTPPITTTTRSACGNAVCQSYQECGVPLPSEQPECVDTCNNNGPCGNQQACRLRNDKAVCLGTSNDADVCLHLE